jgi:hypothetical protein
MIFKKLKEVIFGWTCVCGNNVEDDRNFCVQCDREKPFKH